MQVGMAIAFQVNFFRWSETLYHLFSLSVDDDAVLLPLPLAKSPEDADVLVVDLTEDGIEPWSEAWYVYQLPCICPRS